MYKNMKKQAYLIFFIWVLILMPGSGEAYIPQAPHLLHLVVQKIKQPVGIEAHQIKTVLTHEGSEQRFNDIEEKLIYVFPNKLRSQNISDAQTGFTVESNFKFIKVINGQVVSREKSAVDLYTDILLYRNHESLLKQLVSAGIDTQKVSFQRYEGIICYLIGTPESGLWIDKETFFPVRYVVKKNNWTVEFVYNNWQLLSKTWYPMSASIYLDGQLLVTIAVKNFVLTSQASSKMFDIEQIKLMYPVNEEAVSVRKIQDEALDKGLENFKKLYE